MGHSQRKGSRAFKLRLAQVLGEQPAHPFLLYLTNSQEKGNSARGSSFCCKHGLLTLLSLLQPCGQKACSGGESQNSWKNAEMEQR